MGYRDFFVAKQPIFFRVAMLGDFAMPCLGEFAKANGKLKFIAPKLTIVLNQSH
jgi:hypothetical protein